MCSGRSRKPQRRVHPSVRSTLAQPIKSVCSYFLSIGIPVHPEGGRSDWSCELPSLITLDQASDKNLPRGECLFQATCQASLGNENDKMGRSLWCLRLVLATWMFCLFLLLLFGVCLALDCPELVCFNEKDKKHCVLLVLASCVCCFVASFVSASFISRLFGVGSWFVPRWLFCLFHACCSFLLFLSCWFTSRW